MIPSYGKSSVLLPSFIRSSFTFFSPLPTSLPTQFSILFFCESNNSATELQHRVPVQQQAALPPSEVEILYVKQAGGKGLWSQKKMNDASLCALPCFTAAHIVSIHFLQRHCYKARFWNILKCSSQTSVFQQVSLRNRDEFRLWQAEKWFWTISYLHFLYVLICLFWSVK